MYIVSWIQNKMWSYSRCIVNQIHHSSVIIIITITAYHCSLFNVYQTVTACYRAKTAGCSHYRWEFYYSHIKYAIPIPIIIIPIPISSSKTTPIPMGIPWESNGNGNSHSHAHLKYVLSLQETDLTSIWLVMPRWSTLWQRAATRSANISSSSK